MLNYTVQRTELATGLSTDWDAPAWAGAETLEVSNFRPESSNHRPYTQVRLLYDDQGIHGIFRVADRYVRCVHTRFNDRVCDDSCVEFFVQPRAEGGYVNFEFNCGGALLSYFITDWTRVGDAFAVYAPLSEDEGRQVAVATSLPEVVEPEIAFPVEWTLRFTVPFALLEHYFGELGRIPGQTWRANFYKCGDQTSHPHWAAWSPVDELNFHLPRSFGEIYFAQTR